MTNIDSDLLARLWAQLDGPTAALTNVELTGPHGALPAVYAVGAFATATVAAATTAVAELHALRTGRAQRAVRVERRQAAVAFRSERYLTGIGWKLPEAWDALAGDYATSDGFIRLHTNYASHRAAALRALAAAPTRRDVARALAARSGEELELAVVAQGGCAARMRSAAEWASHPQGIAVAAEPLCAVRLAPAAEFVRLAPAAQAGLAAPLAGVRVLDLTRVIAGPVCTRVLAAYGADVLRIDPPGFEEVPALLGDTTAGKRRAALDLRQAADRASFERLVRGADVLVHGYRAGALERLGLGASQLREWNPALVDVSLNAYGATGPWSGRRGFDSLVQMSCGIAARGQEANAADRPVPLPAQALDHGAGYLLAAATCRALVRLLVDGTASEVRLSLARTAHQLMQLTDTVGQQAHELTSADVEPWCEQANSAFGRLQRVRCPGSIEGIAPLWRLPAGPLGSDPPLWS